MDDYLLDASNYSNTTGKVFVLLIFLFQSQMVSAKPQDKSEDKQLALFSEAYRLADKPKNKRFLASSKQLEGHPLYPYLVQKGLMAYPYLSNEKLIRSFLDSYQGSPLDRPLRTRWLKYLKQKKQYALFNEFYKPTDNTELRCTYLHNALKLDVPYQQLREQIQSLWVVGKSQPKSCDPLFVQMKSEGDLSREMILKRIEEAADGGKHTLLPYLKTLLSSSDQYIVDAWYRIRRSPAALAKPKYFSGRLAQQEVKVVLYGLKRLIWRDPDEALRLWDSYQQRYTFSQQQQQQMQTEFAIRLSVKGHSQAEAWLDRVAPLFVSEKVTQWFITNALRNNDWQAIVTLISGLPNIDQQKLSTRYWYGMALINLDREREGLAVLTRVAKNRHYYGFLASQFLKLPVSLDDSPLQYSAQQLSELEQHPAAQRAYAFYQLSMMTEARREWRYFVAQLEPEAKAMAAVIVDGWGWHEQSILTFVAANYFDDVQRRFPLGHKDTLLQSAQSVAIDPAWAFAIIRKESAFSKDAYSGAGARGLMQLLPSTARYISKEKVSPRQLYQAERNIKYGTMYLKYLLGKTENNPVLATAAYNAGWRNVRKWAPRADKMRFDIWVETIPFRETRDYVKSVIAYHQIYSLMLEPSTPRVFVGLPQLFIHRKDFGL